MELLQTTRQHHPAAALIPEATPEQYETLREDIGKHGQRVPIIISSDGQIIDGRTRDRACRELGIAPLYRPVSPTEELDVPALVLSLNAVRRHLSADQVAAIYLSQQSQKDRASCEALSPTAAVTKVRRGKRGQGKTAAKIAQQIGVSRATVNRVKKVQKVAPHKLAEVADGKTSAVEVLREVTPPVLVQGPLVKTPLVEEQPYKFEDISERLNSALSLLEEYQEALGFGPHQISALGATFDRFSRLMKSLEEVA